MEKALFSSSRDDWETPREFFEELNKEFNFALDPCATPETAKCSRYFTPEDDGLNRPWVTPGGICILQSAVLTAKERETRSRGLDQKGGVGGRKTGGRRRATYSSSDRYRRFPRLYISSCGNPLYPRETTFSRRRKKGRRGPFSEYGSDF